MRSKVLLLVTFAAVITFCKSKQQQAKSQTAPVITPPAQLPQAPAVGLNLGNTAPEITQKGLNGNAISLSSLRGKIVLIDFWASWCGPCRFENPAVVKAWSLYKDKKFRNGEGFTVYSVSLDANADMWKKAIEKDGLAWESHVSDLKGWDNEAAARYGVSSIPSNFLINGNGVIINTNLKGEALAAALEKITVQ